MPLFYFKCTGCGSEFRKILTPDQGKKTRNCDDCGSLATRDVKPPTAQTVETLDTGNMVRPVTRLTDAERLFKERHDINHKKMIGEKE